MNRYLDALQPYPFEKLAKLLAGVTPPANLKPITLTIGEPKHAPPAFVLDTLRQHLDKLGSYPATAGLPELRAACARWLERRFGLGANRVNADSMVLPVNGTREALFAAAQAIVDTSRAPVVAMPNPFYQIYEGAALLAGAEPFMLDTTPANRFVPDLAAVPGEVWERCQLLYLCSPGNPTGAVLTLDYWREVLALATRYDFLVAADECYAELYSDESQPAPSLLRAAQLAGHHAFERCLVFHSLSKRSSLPGLRSGFVAGDPQLIRKFLLYRTYHGSAMSVPTQLASIAAWNDDAHVSENRALYREKFARVVPILTPLWDVATPDGGFYLWPAVGSDDQAFTRAMYGATAVTVLPGSYLSRSSAEGNPGAGRVRISLVAPLADCIDAAQRIRHYLEQRR